MIPSSNIYYEKVEDLVCFLNRCGGKIFFDGSGEYEICGVKKLKGVFHRIIPDRIEASEFVVKEGAPVIGKPLCELQLKNNVLIAAILRGKKVIIPRGQHSIEAGDHVVIVSEMMAMHDISDVLR